MRDELWVKACKKIKDGNVIQIWRARTEQGFEFRQFGKSARSILNYEGVALVTTFKPSKGAKQPGKSTPPGLPPEGD